MSSSRTPGHPAARSPGRWDGPFYRVGTDHFDASFLPDAGEPLDAVGNVDVEVRLRDGSRWSATIVTLARVEALMEQWAASGEALGGRYFRCSDGLIVRDAGIAGMVDVLTELFTRGELTEVPRRPADRPAAAQGASARKTTLRPWRALARKHGHRPLKDGRGRVDRPHAARLPAAPPHGPRRAGHVSPVRSGPGSRRARTSRLWPLPVAGVAGLHGAGSSKA